ncbi:MAG: phosphomevalonate kinase [Candidatus Aenigmatarchaeota archaeon]
MLKIASPGKMFLSGEWAILELGNTGLVAAVDKKVFCEIKKEEDISVTVEDFGIKDIRATFDGANIEWQNAQKDEKDILVFMKGAIETTLRYLGEFEKFHIVSWGEMSQLEVDGEKKKIGFGSSAASVVSTVSSILALHGHDITKRETKNVIYKLSTIAHYFAQGKVGSAFDVAASTFGGIFIYKRFDPNWLEEAIETGRTIKNIVKDKWPGLYIEELEIPEDFILDIGWTKKSASTSAMVKQMKGFKEKHGDEYKMLYDAISGTVKQLISHWKQGDKQGILDCIKKNEHYLRELSMKSDVPIETPDLRLLSEIANGCGAAGKLSGAGGGDCGISISFDKKISEEVKEKWKKADFYIIDATLDRKGVRLEN